MLQVYVLCECFMSLHSFSELQKFTRIHDYYTPLFVKVTGKVLYNFHELQLTLQLETEGILFEAVCNNLIIHNFYVTFN